MIAEPQKAQGLTLKAFESPSDYDDSRALRSSIECLVSLTMISG